MHYHINALFQVGQKNMIQETAGCVKNNCVNYLPPLTLIIYFIHRNSHIEIG